MALKCERGVDGKVLPLRERRTDPYGLPHGTSWPGDCADDDGESAADADSAGEEAVGTTMTMMQACWLAAPCIGFFLVRADSIFDSMI